MTARLRCEVHEEPGGRWSLTRNGKVVRADFPSERAAAAAAIWLAHEAERRGRDATVAIHEAGGPPLSWSYGHWPA